MGKEFINGRYIIKFSDEEKEQIVDWFVNKGYSMRKICEEFDISGSTQIVRVLDEYGIDHSRGNLSSYIYNYPDGIYDCKYEEYILSKISEIPECNSKYNINQYFFDNLRNPIAIYMIGFLYADGCNTNNREITLCLEERDGYILETMNKIIGNENKVGFIDYSNKHDFGYNYENQYVLTIYNRRIGEVLNLLGVIPRKSLKLEFPKWLHPSMYSFFINGVFDGDGSIYRYYSEDGKPRNTVLTITSTENFCKALMDISAKYIGINSHIYDASCHNGITRVYSICGYNICKKFLDWMYKEKTIFLQRKFERYCDYYNIQLSNSIVA